jgi:hypothetical protein
MGARLAYLARIQTGLIWRLQDGDLEDALSRQRRAEAAAAEAQAEASREAGSAAAARKAAEAGNAVRDEAGALRVELARAQAETATLRSAAKVGFACGRSRQHPEPCCATCVGPGVALPVLGSSALASVCIAVCRACRHHASLDLPQRRSPSVQGLIGLCCTVDGACGTDLLALTIWLPCS